MLFRSHDNLLVFCRRIRGQRKTRTRLRYDDLGRTPGSFSSFILFAKTVPSVEFLIETRKGAVLPIEVKSGKDYKLHTALNSLLGTDVYGSLRDRGGIRFGLDPQVLGPQGLDSSSAARAREGARRVKTNSATTAEPIKVPAKTRKLKTIFAILIVKIIGIEC